MRFINTTIIFFLAAVFLVAGVDKLLHYEGFLNALRNYVLVPRGAAPFLALPVILVELLVAAGLCRKSWRPTAALTAAVVLAVFTAALGLNRALGGRGICGCWFTLTLARSTELHITYNVILLCLALTVWWESRTMQPRSRQLHPMTR